jgi:hypothetical protein
VISESEGGKMAGKKTIDYDSENHYYLIPRAFSKPAVIAYGGDVK